MSDFHILVRVAISFNQCLEIDGLSNFNSETSTSSDGPWCEVYGYCPCISSFTLCCMDHWLILIQDLVFFMLSWFLPSCYAESSIWCTCYHNSSCYALRSLVVCCWDTLVVVMHVFCFDILFVSCWWDAHHACFCVILIGVLIEISSCGTSLRGTPVWGHFSLYDRDIISVYITIIDNT